MPENKPTKNQGNLPILQTDQNHPKTRQKSGRGRIRACVLILVHVFILLHITHYWLGGRSLSPVEPSEVMYTLELGQVNAGAILFGLAIISTVVFGRFFCGWGCHIVALQDLCGYLLRRSGIRPKPFRSRFLVLVPFAVAFYMFCWPTVKRLWRGEPHPGFSNHLLTENFWQTFPGPFITVLTFVVCGGLIVYLLGNKGFCTYACPYGAFFSVSDRLAVGRIRVTDACQHCGQCTANCTSNVMVHAEVRDFGMVVDPGCMKCMDCVSVCPNDALYFGLTSKTGAGNLPVASASSEKPARRRKSYDFSITEELFGLIVAAVTVYAIRGLYDGPAFLLAVALGVMTAYLAIQFCRVFRVRDLRIQNMRLKNAGRITKTGWWAVFLLSVWFAFNIHSCFVQFHKYRGREHLNRIAITWPELLAVERQNNFTGEDRANIDKAITSFQYSDQFGLLDVMEVKLGLVYTNLMKGDTETAEKYLRQAYRHNPSAVRQMLMEFLASQGRQEELKEFL
jgi:polyferredoxin